jgi:hypothetical protein
MGWQVRGVYAVDERGGWGLGELGACAYIASGWEIAHEADSRRLTISLDMIVARAEGYTYAADVWD